MKISVQSVQLKETSLEINKYICKEKRQIVLKRLLVLQCVASGQGKTLSEIAKIVGVTRFSVSDWFKLYMNSGIEGLLNVGESGKKTGSCTIMSQNTIGTILEKLSDPDQGFKSYYEISNLASQLEGRELKYSAVRRFFVDNYGVKLKRLRPSNVKKDAHKEDLVKKKLPIGSYDLI